jgi:hypothetical protein
MGRRNLLEWVQEGAMRVRGRSILLGLLLAAGCGGSVVSGAGDAGNASGGNGGSGGSGAVGAGANAATTGGSGPVFDGGVTLEAGDSAGTTPVSGHCTDPADLAAYKASYPLQDGGMGSVYDIAQACALPCPSQPDPNACTLACIEQQTKHAFSQGCAMCFVDVTACGLQNCITDCLASKVQCNACLCAHGCFAALVACTGVPDYTCAMGGP